MSERQRLFWRIMGLERRLSGPLARCGRPCMPAKARWKQRADGAAAATAEASGAPAPSRPPAETTRGRPQPPASKRPKGQVASKQPVADRLPPVEEIQVPHLAAGLFESGAAVPAVGELAGSGKSQKLAALREWLGDCRRCHLYAERSTVVFGEGNADARIVFVGEGPGVEEDRTGRPFVGRAGKLLDQMIEAMGLKRAHVYICNVIKCRPPGNRTPTADEAAVCGPVMYRQLDIIAPELIAALGGPAVQALLETRDGIMKLRGRLFRYGGSLLLPTLHPAYLLRNPAAKKTAWQDLLIACRLLGLAPRRAGQRTG